MKRLGGQKVLADVWSTLQASSQAGHHKRPAADDSDDHYALKKRKTCAKVSGSNSIIEGPAAIADDLLPVPCCEVQNSTPLEGSVPTKARRIAIPKRPLLIAPSKVKEWLFSSDASGTLPSKTKETVPATVPASSPALKPKQKRKRTKPHDKKIAGILPLSPEASAIPATPPSCRRFKKPTFDAKKQTLQSFLNENSPVLKPRSRSIGQAVPSNDNPDDQLLVPGNGLQAKKCD